MATDIVVNPLKIVAFVITVLSMVGCHRRTYYTPPPVDGLYFDARTAVVADTLVVTVRAVNTSQKYVTIEFDTCGGFNALRLLVERGARRWDSRLWDAHRLEAAANASGGIIQVCAGVPIVTQMKPGSVIPYTLRAPFGRILGDSLSGGRYRVTARLLINGREVTGLNGGQVDIAPPNTR